MASLSKEGKYWKVYWYQNGKHHKRSTRTTNKALAEQIKRKIEDELAADSFSIPLPSQKITLYKFLDLAEKYSEINKSPRTFERDKQVYNAFKNFAGDLPLNQINGVLIENYKKKMLDDHKRSGVNVHLRHLSAAFTLAVEPYKFLLKNPFMLVKKLKTEKLLPKFFSEDQAKTLLEHTVCKPIYQFIMISLYSGARLSEVCNLEWKDVDLKNNKIKFYRKGAREDRIPIPKILSDYLKSIKSDAKYVVSGRRERKYISWLFRKTADDLGLKEFSFHSLRYTYASWLVQRGRSLREVQELLGHRNITTTEIYAHLTPDNLRDAVSVLDVKK